MTADVKKITVFYGHVASNLGDLAINSGQSQLLSQAYPNAKLNVVFFGGNKNYINQSIKSFGPALASSFVFLKSSSKAIKFILDPISFLSHCGALNSDLIVIAAGEFYFSYKKNLNTENLFWRTIPIIAARDAKIPNVILPSTYGPLETDFSIKLMKEVLRGSSNIATRESESQRFLESLGFGITANTYLDPAFFIDTSLLLGPECPTEPPHIAVSVRTEFTGIRLSQSQRHSISVKNSISYRYVFGVVNEILTRNKKKLIKIYVQTIADEKLATQLAEDLTKSFPNSTIYTYRPITVADYIQSLRSATYVITSRFHAAIIALLLKKPVYSFYFQSHGHKLPGLFSDFEINEHCINLSVPNVEEDIRLSLTKIASQNFPSQRISKIIDTRRREEFEWLQKHSLKSTSSRQILKSELKVHFMEFFLKQLQDEDASRVKQFALERTNLIKELESQKAHATQKDVELKRYQLERTNLIKELDRARKQQQLIRQSASFKIGAQFLKDSKRIFHWPLFPIKVYRIYKQRLRHKAR